MRYLTVVLALVLVAGTASAQEVTIGTPVTRTSEAKYKIAEFHVYASPLFAQIEVSVRDSGNVEIRRFTVPIPNTTLCPTATVAGLGTAMNTTRATETGTDLQKQQFRVLGYLFDRTCLPGQSAVSP